MSMGPIDISAGGFFDPQEIERQRRVAAQWAPFLAGGGFGGNAKAEPMPTPQRPQEVQGPGQQAPAAAAPVKSAGLYGFEQDQKRGPMEFGGLGGTAGQDAATGSGTRGSPMNRNGGEPGTGSTGNYASNPFGDASFEFGQDSLANRPARRVGGVRKQELEFGGYREKGGPVDPRKAYVVGENGPEVIVPTRPGVVVPNHMLPPSGMMPPGMMPPGMTEPMRGGTGQSPMNRPYGSDARTMIQGGAPSQFDQLQMRGFGAGSLANTPARPVGRSIADHPERRIEMAERDAVANGDMAGAARMAGVRLGVKQQQQGMDFARERDATGFAQGMMMFGLQQQAQAARDEQEKRDRLQLWNAEQEAKQRQAEERWKQQLTMFGLGQGYDAMEAERKRQEQEQERKRVPTIGTIPVAGTDYVIPHADGRPMGTLPMKQPDPKPPEGMVPQAANINGVHYGPPAGKAERPHIEMIKDALGNSVPHSVHVDPETGRVTMRKVKIIDADKDGVDDRAVPPGGAATSGKKPSGFLNF